MRSFKRIQRALVKTDHWRAFFNAFKVYKKPLRELRNYIFDAGRFPYLCEINTARGGISITVENSQDLRVIHEIFCGEIYKYPDISNCNVIDIGSNIGISTLFFIYQLGANQVVAFEPNPKNTSRFKKNCQHVSATISFNEYAVAPGDFIGTRKMSFGVETYGHYGGLSREIGELCDAGEHQISEKISVNAVSIGQLIRNQEKPIALIKLDTEGNELMLLASLPRNDLKHIQRVCIDGCYPLDLIQRVFCPYLTKITPRGNSMFIELLGATRFSETKENSLLEQS